MSQTHYFCPLYSSARCELSVCCGSCYSSFDSYRCHIYCFHRSLVDSFDSDSVIPSNIDNNDSYIQPDANNQSDHIEDPDSFIYRDEECDETDDLINNFDPISFTTIDEKCSFDILLKLYTHFLLELREYHLLPQKVVQLISSNISNLLEVILKLIKTKQSASVLTVVDLETIFTHCQKHFNYELPIEIVLNTSEDHAYYIPLKISLSHLLHSGELLDAINNNTQSLIIQSNKDNDLILSNRQCRSIKSNTSNRKNSDFLLLKLYSDGIGITNPIGPKKDSHKFTCFYFLLDDLPNVLRSQVNLIGLHCIAYTKHLKDKDSRDVLMNVLIQDFNQLQTQGITVPCISSRLYFSFSFLCGDNLASNELGGFQKNFNSGHFCRHCLITYEQRLIPLTDISFVPRTHLRHDLIVDRIVSNNDGQTLFGVSGDSWFRNLIGFHPTESLPPDLMHDTAEGVCPLIISALLKEAVQQRILTYAQIERRTSSFIFGFYDSSNKPPPAKKQHVFHSNITGSANEDIDGATLALFQHNDNIQIFPRIKDRVKFVDLRTKLISNLIEQDEKNSENTSNLFDLTLPLVSFKSVGVSKENDTSTSSSSNEDLQLNSDNNQIVDSDPSSLNGSDDNDNTCITVLLPADYEGPNLTMRMQQYVDDNNLSKFFPHTAMRSELLTLLYPTNDEYKTMAKFIVKKLCVPASLVHESIKFKRERERERKPLQMSNSLVQLKQEKYGKGKTNGRPKKKSTILQAERRVNDVSMINVADKRNENL
ncbi:unnamed protein product [Rotaria socialis]|uniref:C2H2-type domain-containing protein n=1 Tax=Rotaria socialis TaxID=392032 RepID=A0A820MLT3_9BILA|nr:unnamed protein product [Rotaria socialis]